MLWNGLEEDWLESLEIWSGVFFWEWNWIGCYCKLLRVFWVGKKVEEYKNGILEE